MASVKSRGVERRCCEQAAHTSHPKTRRSKLAEPAETREAIRAREVDALLGPKSSDERAVDLVVDLHNTTSDPARWSSLDGRHELW